MQKKLANIAQRKPPQAEKPQISSLKGEEAASYDSLAQTLHSQEPLA